MKIKILCTIIVSVITGILSISLAAAAATATLHIQTATKTEPSQNVSATSNLPNVITKQQKPTTTQATTDQTSAIPVANVLQFGEQVAKAAFTYDYQNYPQQFKQLSTHFTQDGWDSFTKALKDSNNLVAVLNAKLSVTCELVGKASLVKRGKFNDQDAWWVTIPIIVTYTDPKNVKLVQHLHVDLRIIKVSKDLHPQQISVNQFIARPAEDKHQGILKQQSPSNKQETKN